VHVVVLVGEGIVVRTCAQITLLVAKEILLVSGECPHADVELAALEQHGPLDILLDYPVGIELARGEEFLDLLQTIEDLDPPTLIHVSRLHKPVVLLAVLLWRLFLKAGTIVLLQVHVPSHKLMKLIGVE
jgi:hypothetical protein